MTVPVDLSFCRKAFGFGSDQAVRDWFAQTVLPDFRTFSPDFSPTAYLLDHADVREAAAHPVRHYLDWGRDENREVSSVKRLAPFAGGDGRTELASAMRVAVMLHIYYADYVEEFLARIVALAAIDLDVFISTTPEIAEQCGPHIDEVLGERLKARRSIPNVGRNFAPLFVEFATELLGYDVICHVHSKESRYSGRKQTEWASYLIAATLGPPDVVRRHIALVGSGACDVIAPAPFAGLPPWASHVLSNTRHLSELCARLGVAPPRGFMSYPVGGMFWMSAGVFTKIAALGLTYDDFPAEPSEPDGEVHHAIERLIGALAGERLAFYDQVVGDYWAAGAVLRAEKERFAPLEDLKEIIRDFDVISFDFFDTLCERVTADEEWAKRRVEFLLGGDYRRRRNAVEAQLRSQLPPNRDVSLSEIAAALATQGFEEAHRAVQLERELDLRSLRPRPEIADAYLFAIEEEKQVLVISDTYYDSGLIRSFLNETDLPLPGEILASSEVGRRKDRGDLWSMLRERLRRTRALHIGDNVHSDIQLAAGRSFATFYVPHWRDHASPLSGLSDTLRSQNLTNPAFVPVRYYTPPEDDCASQPTPGA